MRTPPRGQLEYHLLVLVTLGLVAFGLVMVYSATSARAVVDQGDPAYYLKRESIYALLGLAALVVCARFDYRALRYAGGPLLAVAFFFLLAVLAVGTAVNGARRWLPLGFFDFQPSELAKLALAIWIATVLARRWPPQTLAELLRPIGLVVCLAFALILVEPDLGTVIAVAIMVGAMLVVSGTPFRVFGSASAIVGILAVAAIWLEPYRRTRLLSFLDPWSDPQGAGFQVVQATISLGSGGLFGRGLGESIGKVNYLPEAHTDMLFAVIGEELGLVGGALVIAAFAVFGYAGFNVALRCRDPFGKRLAVGLTALVLGQAVVNLCAVMGIAPLTGIPLPFVSYGGSSMIVSLASVGVLLNIAVNHAAQVAANKVPDRGRRHRGTRAAVARDRGGPEREGRRRHVRGVA